MHSLPATARTQGLSRHRAGWVALAVLLAVAGVLLLVQREQEPARSHATVPRSRDEGNARAYGSATLAPPPVSESAVAPPPRRDPLLAALPMKPDSPVFVFEMNALRYSPLGERILACMRGQGGQNAFTDLARESGIDPQKDIDRVAFLGDSTVVSGHFDQARWNQTGSPGESYGQGGRIYTTPRGVVGSWRDQIVMLSSGPEDARKAIDQLEGRAPVPETGFPEEMSHGDIYGLVPGAAARRALGGGGEGGEGGLNERIASLASRIELHVDAMQDLAAEVRIRGDDAAGLADLAKGLGTALTAARLKSQITGNKSLSALLENAAVRPGEGGLSIKFAVPAAQIGDLLGDDCKIFGAPPAQ